MLQPRKELSALSFSTLVNMTRSPVTTRSQSPKPPTNSLLPQNRVYSAKLAVFRAFCSSFDETAKQFTSGPALQFAQNFSSSFLQYWTDVFAGTQSNLPATKPSYAAVVGARRPWQQQRAPRRQGQRNTLPPPKDDLRVFARLGAGLTADMSRSFAVRTHITDKLGIPRSRIPQAHPCKTGRVATAGAGHGVLGCLEC